MKGRMQPAERRQEPTGKADRRPALPRRAGRPSPRPGGHPLRPEHPGDFAASPRHDLARAAEGGEASAVPRGRTGGALAPPSAWAFDPHPDREAVANELHARPFADVRPPVRVSHLAFLSAEEDAERDREHLAALCARLGAVPPAPGARHHMADFGPVAVKWERHTEFSSYTFLRPAAPADPFADPALAAVPADWLAATPGRLLVAVHLAPAPADPGRGDRELVALCGSDRYAGATVAGGAAAVWSDFRLHGDGLVRLLAEDRGRSERQAGRLVQRLLEVETYRTAALLALPLALRLWPEVRALERQLAALACRVAEVGDLGDERALLDELARLDAAATRLAAENGYRFAAARAYPEIARRRLPGLRGGGGGGPAAAARGAAGGADRGPADAGRVHGPAAAAGDGDLPRDGAAPRGAAGPGGARQQPPAHRGRRGAGGAEPGHPALDGAAGDAAAAAAADGGGALGGGDQLLPARAARLRGEGAGRARRPPRPRAAGGAGRGGGGAGGVGRGAAPAARSGPVGPRKARVRRPVVEAGPAVRGRAGGGRAGRGPLIPASTPICHPWTPPAPQGLSSRPALGVSAAAIHPVSAALKPPASMGS